MSARRRPGTASIDQHLHTISRTAMALLLAGVLGGCGGGSGSARDAGGDSGDNGQDEGPFAGANIDFVVPYEPGGGYDAYARSLAPFFEECLDATVVVRNEPGAGGLLATNQTAVAGPNDNRFQIVNTVGLVSAQIAGEEGATFDLEDLNWVGRVSAPPNVIVVGNDSPYESFQDVVNSEAPVRFVAQGPGSNDYLAPTIVGEAYGFPYEIVSGFAGSAEARQSVIAGDADAHVLPIDSQLPAIEAGEVKPIVTIDEERDSLLPDVPTIYEAAEPQGDAVGIINSLVGLGQTGRALIASPNLPDDKLNALRDAWDCVVTSTGATDTLEAQDRPLNPLGGEETADLVTEVLNAPEQFAALVRESF